MTDGFFQRDETGLSVITREDEEARGIFWWKEDYS
jgi:hypothetical protein